MSLNGIDTSKWQAGLPDATINADFIIFKATEGVGYVDPDCAASHLESVQAGKLVGVYHFARPDGNDPISEADFFVDNIQGYIGNTLLVLDWEVGPVNNVAWAKQWLDHVQFRTGVKPLIYMSESVVNSYDWSSVANADYGLWVARYRDYTPDYNYDMSNAGQVPDVKWWANGYCMWQWTSSGILDGWGGSLDCNIFYGDRNTWLSYVKGYPVSQPSTPPVVPVHVPVITTETEHRVESIPFSRRTYTDTALANGTIKITQIGVNGTKLFTDTVTYTDGKETARTSDGGVVTTQPREELTVIGTYIEPVKPPVVDIPAEIKIESPFMSLLRLFWGVLSKLITKSKR